MFLMLDKYFVINTDHIVSIRKTVRPWGNFSIENDELEADTVLTMVDGQQFIITEEDYVLIKEYVGATTI